MTTFQLPTHDFCQQISSLEPFVNDALTEYVDHLYGLSKKRNLIYRQLVSDWYAQSSLTRVLKKFFLTDGIEPVSTKSFYIEECLSKLVDLEKFKEISIALESTRQLIHFGVLRESDKPVSNFLSKNIDSLPWYRTRFPKANSLIFPSTAVSQNNLSNYRMIYDITTASVDLSSTSTLKETMLSLEEHSKREYFSFAWVHIEDYYRTFLRLRRSATSEKIKSVESILLDTADFDALVRLHSLQSKYATVE